MKIEIKMPTLLKQRPTEVVQSFLELNEDNARYCVEFTADEFIDFEDESLGHEAVFNFIDILALKTSISGIELSNVTKQKLYVVIICVSGFSQDIKIYFRKREAAQELRNQIKNWLLNENQG